MGRRRKHPVYVIVAAENLGCVGKDREVHLDSEPDDNLLDELQCPVADDVLIALRKSFSLSYPRNPFIDGLQAALTEIRRIGIEALKPIPEVLAGIGLKPVPAVEDDKTIKKVFLFQFAFAKRDDLRIKVKYEGKERLLLNLLETFPADAVVTTLRKVVSDTFSEMHNEEDHENVLRGIREQIAAVLPPFNELLESIEIEPIAVPRTDDSASEASGADDSDEQVGASPLNPE